MALRRYFYGDHSGTTGARVSLYFQTAGPALFPFSFTSPKKTSGANVGAEFKHPVSREGADHQTARQGAENTPPDLTQARRHVHARANRAV